MSDLKINSIYHNPISYKANRNISNPNFKQKSAETPNVEVKTISKNVNKSNKTKVFATLALVTVVGVVGVKSYRNYYINKAQKTFKDVFMRDNITKDETIKILKRYKEIEKIKDKEKYAKAVFEEAKKNFGFENKPIDFVIKDLKDSKARGGCCPYNSFIETDLSKGDRSTLLEHIHHEFRHAKQHEIFYNQYPDFAEERFLKKFLASDEFIEKGSDEMFDLARRMVKDGKTNEEILNELKVKYKVEIQELIKKYIGETSPNNVPEKYKDFAKKCYENSQNYISIDKDETKYFNQYVEKDARDAASKIAKLIKDYIIPV